MSRDDKTRQQRAKRAAAAMSAGRVPGRTGRPPTGRKAPTGPGDRAAQYRRRRARQARASGDQGWVESRHPIMDEAMAVADRHVRRSGGRVYHWPLWEEAVMVAALAICEGADPDQAAKKHVVRERAWLWRHVKLTEYVL